MPTLREDNMVGAPLGAATLAGLAVAWVSPVLAGPAAVLAAMASLVLAMIDAG